MLKVLQLTDMHIFSDPDGALLGVKTQDSFQQVYDLAMKSGFDADMMLMTGDLIQDSKPTSYQKLAALVSGFKKPIYWIPGNHDSQDLRQGSLAGPNIKDDKLIVDDKWQIIMVDSQKPGHVEGTISQAELDKIDQALQDNPKHHALVVLHHQPVDINTAWLDKIGLDNGDELWAVLDKYPRVQGLLWGHIHQDFEGMRNHVRLMATPSTCIQFTPNVVNFNLDSLYPGYRWLILHDDGRIESEVVRLPTFDGKPDPDAGGY